MQDTLRGTVEIVGSDPIPAIALLDGRGGGMTLVGEESLLRQLSGLEVVVWGALTAPRVFRVTRVSVRAHAGVPATDGVLTREGNGWVLVTPDGRLPLTELPEALRGREGTRVWLAGPLDRTPDAFGIIR